MTTTRAHRLRRQHVVAHLVVAQRGVASLPQLYAAGLSRADVQAEVRGRRWRRVGPQCVVLHNGPISPEAMRIVAVLNAGADAALDGVSALIEAGLCNFEESVVHLSVSKGTRYRRRRGVRIHETRRRRPEDVLEGSVPRVDTPIAAVRAALWARTNRQAALVLAMTVQQRLTTIDAIVDAFATVKRDRRRGFIKAVLRDIGAGAESMGELDFLRMCRRRSLPAPSRQVRRVLPSGRAFLDVYWDEFGVVLEIEGAHHLIAGIAIDDSLRQNELTIDNDRVLRIPVLGLHVAADELFDQLERLLRRRGWRSAA